jgi:hypothetical protein
MVQGWPVLLLSEQSLHSQNIKAKTQASLFVQMPKNGAESVSGWHDMCLSHTRSGRDLRHEGRWLTLAVVLWPCACSRRPSAV